ncbi:hypothetical protein [Streptomyces sp. SGAir0957]
MVGVRAALLLAAAFIVRKIATAVGGGLYRRIEDAETPWLLWAAAAWWIVSAYRAGAKDWKPKRPAIPPEPAESQAEPEAEPEAKAEEKDGEQPAADGAQEKAEPAAGAAPADPPRPILSDLRIALARIGTPHAHLAALAADIGTTPERVRRSWTSTRSPSRRCGCRAGARRPA